jgi:hypothetical protein
MDFAVPLRNPYLKNDIDRWIFNEKFDKIREEFKPQLNIGIGYPF